MSYRGVGDVGIGGSSTISVTTRAVQQALIRAGFDVGPAGADNDWGPATAGAFVAARGRTSLPFVYTVAPDKRSVSMPSDAWLAIQTLPAAPPARPGTTTTRTTTTPGGSTIGPDTYLPPEPATSGGPNLLPWILGGVALAAIGAYFYFTPAKGSRPVAANKRRRHQRRMGSRRSKPVRRGKKRGASPALRRALVSTDVRRSAVERAARRVGVSPEYLFWKRLANRR